VAAHPSTAVLSIGLPRAGVTHCWEQPKLTIMTIRQTRDVPSPAFNVESKERNVVQPLVNPRANEMDESYVAAVTAIVLNSVFDLHEHVASLVKLEEKFSTR
jgi:hypothetical protein